MSDVELGERVAVVETEIRTVVEQLKPIVGEWPRLLSLVESTHQQALRTNGKVRRFEKREIEREAREDERRKMTARKTAEAVRREARRAQRRGWIPPAAISVVSATLGWALSHFLG